jgi:hypothetical protein
MIMFRRLFVPLVLVSLFLLPSLAQAETLQPWWSVTQNVRPAVLPAGGEGLVVAEALNVGDASTSGPVTITDTLPEGVTVQKALVKGVSEPKVSFVGGGGALGAEWGVGEEGRFHGEGFGPEEAQAAFHACGEPAPRVVRCVFEEFAPGFKSTLAPYEFLELGIAVSAEAGAPAAGASTIEVSGGGAPAVRAARPVPVGEAAPSFGLEEFTFIPEAEGGGVDARAGSHPYQLLTTTALDQNADPLTPPALARNFSYRLPAGFVGNATAIPQCSEADFETDLGSSPNPDLCPADTAVGVATLTLDIPSLGGGEQTDSVPLFNLVPAVGEPARFGFELYETPVTIDTSVRTGSDYGVTATVTNTTELANFLAATVTFWGVPGAASHNLSRGWSCLGGGAIETHEPCSSSSAVNPPPFLTLPTSCAAPWSATVEGSSWPLPAEGQAQPASVPLPASTYSLTDAAGAPVSLTGCDRLAFRPFVEVSPDVQQASSPSGLTVHVRVPQEDNQDAGGLASSNVKDITVALPAGVNINPSGGGGLEACGEGQVGFEAGRGVGGFEELYPQTEPGTRTPLFSPTLPEPLSPGLELGAKGFCPDAAKIGTVAIHSPLLPSDQPLNGSVYLASQEQNPFGSVIAMYIVAEDPVSGTIVKLPGEVRLCQSAGETIDGMPCEAQGQIVTSFQDEPQLPFEDAELHFFGGERAPLATPSRCGTYTTRASFVPWSGSEPVSSTSAFSITSGPGGGACPGAQLPFNPSLTGGALNLQAGAFSPFTLTMTRKDGEQNLQSVQAKLPLGMSGYLSHVQQCPEPNANQGTCGPDSLIGETTVSVGVGGDPYTVEGGKFYLTGPYNGTGACTVGTPPAEGSNSSGCAPFGVTFVVPAKAGPFDLAKTQRNHPACDCVLVRGKIEINPETAAITVTSNPPGTPDSIPTQIEGIPLEIQHINATTTRGNFQFNPTSCDKLQATGTIESSEKATDTINVPFQVTNCAVLPFKPSFTASTQAKTSKADGASLKVNVAFPHPGPQSGGQSGEANIHSVKVELPKALPSRLTTLQKACTAKQFDTNPAGCPAESVVGHAIAHTPILPVPLEGPAYFVSNGSEAFPNLIMVLQGYGITIDLVGDTFISKSGITSSTFKAVPDAPVSTFELILPQGPYSALAANGNLCQSKLVMPTEFVAQNGATLDQSTHIEVSGCSKTLSVVSKKVHKRTLKLSVYAPGAGRVTVSGKGIGKGAKSTSGNEAVSFTFHGSRAGKIKLKVSFTPKTGKRQSKTLTVRFGK